MSRTSETKNYSDTHINALAEGKIDAPELVRINDLKHHIQEKLLDAGEIFTSKDRERWLSQVERKQHITSDELVAISGQIDKEAAEIKIKTDQFIQAVNSEKQFFGFNKKKNISEAEQWIQAFKKQPLETKREWMEGLKGRIEQLKALYAEAEKLSPDHLAQFADMTEKEKKDFILKAKNNLDKLDNQTEQLEKILQENKENFSAAELDEIRQKFRSMTSYMRTGYLADFNTEEKVPERTELDQKFKDCPDDYTGNYRDFNALSLDKKRESVRTIEQNITSAYTRMLFDEHGQYGEMAKCMSVQEKNSAYSWFINASLKNKGLAAKFLAEHMKEAKKQTDEYKELLEQLPPNFEQARKTQFLDKFLQSDYQEKLRLKDQLAALVNQETREHKNTLERSVQFSRKLQDLLIQKIITPKFQTAEQEKFAKLGPAEKKLKLDNLDQEYREMAELTASFNRLPDGTKQQHQDFYSLEHENRAIKLKEILAKLEDAPKIKPAETKNAAKASTENAKNPELSPELEKIIAGLKEQARLNEKDGDSKKALNCYQAILALNPENLEARQKAAELAPQTDTDTGSASSREIETAVREESSGDNLKKKRKDYSMLKKFSESTYLNELHNGDKVKSVERVAHLDDKKTQIQDELFNRRGMVLDRQGRAVKIVKVDVAKFDDLDENNKENLRQTLKHKAANYTVNFLNNNFQVTSDGQIISGMKSIEKNNDRKKRLENMIEERAAQSLRAKGRTISEKEKQTLKEQTQAQNLEVDLSN